MNVNDLTPPCRAGRGCEALSSFIRDTHWHELSHEPKPASASECFQLTNGNASKQTCGTLQNKPETFQTNQWKLQNKPKIQHKLSLPWFGFPGLNHQTCCLAISGFPLKLCYQMFCTKDMCKRMRFAQTFFPNKALL